MGRNKINIKRISNERDRKITYYKRRKGLFKKAMELSLLCDSNILLIISSEDNTNSSLYCSNGGNISMIKKQFKNVIDSNLRHNLTNLDYNKLNLRDGGCEDKIEKSTKPNNSEKPEKQLISNNLNINLDTNTQENEISFANFEFRTEQLGNHLNKKEQNMVPSLTEMPEYINSVKQRKKEKKPYKLESKKINSLLIAKSKNEKLVTSKKDSYETSTTLASEMSVNTACFEKRDLNNNGTSIKGLIEVKDQSEATDSSSLVKLTNKLGLKLSIPTVSSKKIDNPIISDNTTNYLNFLKSINEKSINQVKSLMNNVYDNNNNFLEYVKQSKDQMSKFTNPVTTYAANFATNNTNKIFGKKEMSFENNSFAFSPMSSGYFGNQHPGSPLSNSVAGTPNNQFCYNIQNNYNTYYNSSNILDKPTTNYEDVNADNGYFNNNLLKSSTSSKFGENNLFTWDSQTSSKNLIHPLSTQINNNPSTFSNIN